VELVLSVWDRLPAYQIVHRPGFADLSRQKSQFYPCDPCRRLSVSQPVVTRRDMLASKNQGSWRDAPITLTPETGTATESR